MESCPQFVTIYDYRPLVNASFQNAVDSLCFAQFYSKFYRFISLDKTL